MGRKVQRTISKTRRCAPPRRQSTRMTDLPDDVVEFIANHLDQKSFYRFACLNPRFRGVCQHSASLQRIKGADIEDILIQLVSLNASRVRDLDLSNCWLESRSLKELINQCHNVMKLNVANSSLKLAHTRDVLGTLQELEDLSLTFTPKGSVKVKFGLYPSIRKIYIEFPPSHRLRDFAGTFLEHCPGVISLHINIVGESDDARSSNNPMLSIDRLSCYQTIIVSTKMQDRWSYQSVIQRLFGADSSYNYHFMKNASADGVFWFERENADEVQPKLGTLSHRYQRLYLTQNDLLALPDRYRDGQLGLRVDFAHRDGSFRMPDMSPLSFLAELDLTNCHLIITAEKWWSLVTPRSVLRALMVPVCSLSASADSLRGSSVNRNTLDALKHLELSKLHVGVSQEIYPCRYCNSCSVNSAFMESLSDFHRLEELILNDIHQRDDFLASVDKPFSMKTVKLSLREVGSTRMDGLGKFLRLCKNLRQLKFGSLDLPLGSSDLWDALCEANLRQLCLSSLFERKMDPKMLQSRISRLFKNLDVFHLHVNRISNAREISRMIEDEARKANLSRKDRPVRFIFTKFPSMFEDNEYIRTPCFPGRNVCTLKSFIGSVKPVGWDAA